MSLVKQSKQLQGQPTGKSLHRTSPNRGNRSDSFAIWTVYDIPFGPISMGERNRSYYPLCLLFKQPSPVGQSPFHSSSPSSTPLLTSPAQRITRGQTRRFGRMASSFFSSNLKADGRHSPARSSPISWTSPPKSLSAVRSHSCNDLGKKKFFWGY